MTTTTSDQSGFLEIRIPFQCECSYKACLFFNTDKKFPSRIKCQFCGKTYGLATKDREYRIYPFAIVWGDPNSSDIVVV